MARKRTSFDRPTRTFIPIAASVVALLAMAPLHAQLTTGPTCGPDANRPPVAESDVATAYQTIPATIAVLGNDTDPEGNALTIAAITQPRGASVVINGGQSVTYTSSTTFSGADAFTYVIKDGMGGMASGTVDVTVKVPTLVLALGFNEEGGATAVDSSPLHYDGTIREAVRVASQPGFGSALSFDGVNDWVTVGDKRFLRLTTAMTLEAWVYPTGNEGWTTVVMKERPAGLSYSLYARDGAPLEGGTTKPSGYVRINFIDRPVRGANMLPPNTWTHIATTYDSAYQRFYVNGVLTEQRAQSGKVETSFDPIRIGGNTAWGEFFKGLIDDVRIYNLALSQAEIQADMATPLR